MNKKKLFSKPGKPVPAPAAKVKVNTDFLPSPEKLTKKESKVKVTITLNQGTVNFFKNYAEKNNIKYQTMINEVLDKYAQKYK
jgi:predicted DNA binding CopG/RHH family protein